MWHLHFRFLVMEMDFFNYTIFCFATWFTENSSDASTFCKFCNENKSQCGVSITKGFFYRHNENNYPLQN